MSDEEQLTVQIGSEFLPRPGGYLSPHALHQHLKALSSTCTTLAEASLLSRREKQTIVEQSRHLLEENHRLIQECHDLHRRMTSYRQFWPYSLEHV